MFGLFTVINDVCEGFAKFLMISRCRNFNEHLYFTAVNNYMMGNAILTFSTIWISMSQWRDCTDMSAGDKQQEIFKASKSSQYPSEKKVEQCITHTTGSSNYI